MVKFIGGEIPKGYSDPVADAPTVGDKELDIYKKHPRIIHKGKQYTYIGVAHKKMNPMVKALRTVAEVIAMIFTGGKALKSESFRCFHAATQLGLTPVVLYTRSFFFAQKILAGQKIQETPNNEAKLMLAETYRRGTAGTHYEKGELVEEKVPQSFDEAKKLYNEVLNYPDLLPNYLHILGEDELPNLNDHQKKALIGLCQVAIGQRDTETTRKWVILAKNLLETDEYRKLFANVKPDLERLHRETNDYKSKWKDIISDHEPGENFKKEDRSYRRAHLAYNENLGNRFADDYRAITPGEAQKFVDEIAKETSSNGVNIADDRDLVDNLKLSEKQKKTLVGFCKLAIDQRDLESIRKYVDLAKKQFEPEEYKEFFGRMKPDLYRLHQEVATGFPPKSGWKEIMMDYEPEDPRNSFFVYDPDLKNYTMRRRNAFKSEEE